MEDIHRATRRYEQWLGGKIPLVRADLRAKNERMRLGPFLFMRATFYRWCQLWQAKQKELGDAARAAPVAAVGDLHLENFGTWRDSDGRLIWGINDFDETTWRSSPSTWRCAGASPARRSWRDTAPASRRADSLMSWRRRTVGSGESPSASCAIPRHSGRE